MGAVWIRHMGVGCIRARSGQVAGEVLEPLVRDAVGVVEGDTAAIARPDCVDDLRTRTDALCVSAGWQQRRLAATKNH